MRVLKHLALAAAFAASLAAFASAPRAQAQEARTALVIGNSSYSYAKLENPKNDATDVADALRGAGFEVILRADANQSAMKDAIRSFGSALRTKGGVGLLFFAGHGIQVGGENYLMPIGERAGSEDALRSGGVMAAEAVEAMAAARNSLNIVILDACRDNPLTTTAGATRGLSRMDSSASLFVSFSTSPGELAMDGTGRNSPYTKHLKGAIGAANLTLEDTFKRTLKGVYQETAGQQQPWMSSSFFGEFIFRPGGGPAAAAPKVLPQRQASLPTLPRAAPGVRKPGLALGGLYLVDGSNPDGSRYSGMAALTPADDQYRFTWWIGRQVFTGVGQFAGRMMVVNWGSKSPVIYSVAPNDDLIGEWADGSATDQLKLVARAPIDPLPSPRGAYNVIGQNPNGSRYTGRVAIVPVGNRYRFDWRVGSTAYQGVGMLEGNIMVVEWGGGTPVVYALAADGSLKGFWSAGKAQEVLTPAR